MNSFSAGGVIREFDSEMPLEHLSREELEDLKLEVTAELGKIQSQLSKAKGEAAAAGKYSDRDWFFRANEARRHFGRLDQRIALEFRRRNRDTREARTRDLATAFVDIARQKLSREQFTELLDLAHRMIGD